MDTTQSKPRRIPNPEREIERASASGALNPDNAFDAQSILRSPAGYGPDALARARVAVESMAARIAARR